MSTDTCAYDVDERHAEDDSHGDSGWTYERGGVAARDGELAVPVPQWRCLLQEDEVCALNAAVGSGCAITIM